MRPLIYIICCFYAISSYGQVNVKATSATFRLREIALIDLAPNNTTVTLNVVAPDDAGEKFKIVSTNNDKWINFSSAVIAGKSRSISIQMEADQAAPSGIYLKLSTATVAGIGKGVLGSPSGILTLSSTPQTIVSGIGGAFTGNGINNGYKITYSLEIYNYELLDFDQSETLSIILTLTDSI
jgi:hypothetical protein